MVSLRSGTQRTDRGVDETRGGHILLSDAGNTRAGRSHRAALTDRGRGMLAAGVTLTVCGLALGFVDLTRIGVLLTVLPILSRLLAARRGCPIRVQRWVEPAEVTVAVSASVTIRLVNQGRRRTPTLLAEEYLDAGLGGPRRLVVAPIPARQEHTLHYRIDPTRRGRHTAGPLTLYWRDPFGLSCGVLASPDLLDLVVLPRIHPLAEFASGAGGGGESTRHAATVLHGEDDASIRGYHEGDDLRRIHWPVTAHRGELMVRHEGRPTLRRAVLVLDPHIRDADRPADLATRGEEVDWAVEALASVAVHLAAHGFALHLLTPDTTDTADMADRAGRADMAGAGRAEERMPLASVVRNLALVDVAPAVDPDSDPLGDDGAGSSSEAVLRGAAQAEVSPPKLQPGVRPVVPLARDLTGGGGLLVAAVADDDEVAVRELLDVKPVSTTGLLFVLDTGTFAGGPHTPRAGELTRAACTHGWVVTTVTGGDRVPDAWLRLVPQRLEARPEGATADPNPADPTPVVSIPPADRAGPR